MGYYCSRCGLNHLDPDTTLRYIDSALSSSYPAVPVQQPKPWIFLESKYVPTTLKSSPDPEGYPAVIQWSQH